MSARWAGFARLLFPVAALVAAIAGLYGGLAFETLPSPFHVVAPVFALVLIVATVFAVLHHAEAVAHRVGEPYGTLILTLAVTGIEASVIISVMANGENNPTLARESVFSTVMIVCAGIVGVCLTVGGWRHRQQQLRQQGTHAYLSVLIALAMLTLVLPNYTLATPPGTFSTLQLALVSLLSVLLYAGFVFVQTGRHRGDFLEALASDSEGPPRPEGRRPVFGNAILLVIGLAGIVLLTEKLAATIESGLEAMHVEQADAVIGAFVALLVLAPEGVSAIKAAIGNELQRSLNIALGSACATIGLTIPAVALASMVSGRSLTLGLVGEDMVLLVTVLLVSIVSFGTGRTTVLNGLVHLVIFVAYGFLILVP